jgi:Spy/CpxP family protein refolding chaperone
MLPIHRTLFSLIIATACIFAPSTAAQTQNAQPAPATEPGMETGNWGLAPFIPIPTLALNEEAKRTVRELEDQQLRERRTLEDKCQEELRTLLKRQAEEREALLARLTQP